MNFGEAIEAMKNGKRVTRKGWNGKNMYLWLLPAATVKAEWCKEPHLKTLAEENGGEVECLGSIRMKTADNKVLTGWLASQTDMLSEDWELYGEDNVDKTKVYRDVRYIGVDVGCASWGDAYVNGKREDENDPIMPCLEKDLFGYRWKILIDVTTGQILNWEKGNKANVYYKVVDNGVYRAFNEDKQEIYTSQSQFRYVPYILNINDNDGYYGYGDYLGLDIDENGFIKGWPVYEEEVEFFIDDFLSGS